MENQEALAYSGAHEAGASIRVKLPRAHVVLADFFSAVLCAFHVAFRQYILPASTRTIVVYEELPQTQWALQRITLHEQIALTNRNVRQSALIRKRAAEAKLA